MGLAFRMVTHCCYYYYYSKYTHFTLPLALLALTFSKLCPIDEPASSRSSWSMYCFSSDSGSLPFFPFPVKYKTKPEHLYTCFYELSSHFCISYTFHSTNNKCCTIRKYLDSREKDTHACVPFAGCPMHSLVIILTIYRYILI